MAWYTIRERATTASGPHHPRGIHHPNHHRESRAGGSYGGASGRRPVGYRRLVKLWRMLRRDRLRALMMFGVRTAFNDDDLGSCWPFLARPDVRLNMDHPEMDTPESVLVTAHHEQVHVDLRGVRHDRAFARALLARFPDAPVKSVRSTRRRIDLIETYAMAMTRRDYLRYPDPIYKRPRWVRAARVEKS